MFKLILIAILLGLVTAENIDRDAEVRRSENEPADAEGNFAYSFDSTNGIAVQQTGNIAGVSGSAGWVSPEGIPIQLTYTADENGYHPVGDHLPTPPPIPDAILRALEYIRNHPPPVVNTPTVYTPSKVLPVSQKQFSSPPKPVRAPTKSTKAPANIVTSARRG